MKQCSEYSESVPAPGADPDPAEPDMLPVLASSGTGGISRVTALSTHHGGRLADAQCVSVPLVSRELPPWLLPQLPRLRRDIKQSLARALQTGREQYLAFCSAVPRMDPLALFASQPGGDRFFWQHPDTGHGLAALGCAHVLAVAQEQRFASASGAARALFTDVRTCGAEAGMPAAAGPLLVGGFAFSEAYRAAGDWQAFPRARLVLPELSFAGDADRAWLTLCTSLPPGLDPDTAWSKVVDVILMGHQRVARVREQSQGSPERGSGSQALISVAQPGSAAAAQASYCGRIEEALSAIAEGQLEKVVVARSQCFPQAHRVDLEAVLQRLRGAHADCVSVAVARGSDCFLAASPERLVRLVGTAVATEALAGTAPRGVTVAEDRRLGRQLRTSPKERAEHAAVVSAIRVALDGSCGRLEGPAVPQLLRLSGIQHLHTPLRGALLDDGQTVLDLVGRLHPTPAVGGLPRSAALDWIGRAEGLERGWYAGPVGYVDRRGGGEFRVALRSALLRAPTGRGALGSVCVYAGAGIVAGSRPERELRETELKMQALLAPLTER